MGRRGADIAAGATKPPAAVFTLYPAILALAASVFFFFGAPDVFPIDDAYIHFAYAENLASGRGLIFQSPGESGLGTTSALWVGLLAAGNWVGLPSSITARWLGALALAATAALTGALVAPTASRWRAPWLAWGAGGLVALSGPMIWFALSGMETLLFTAIGLAGILLYRARRWGGLGLACGLLCLTRPEGVGLPLAIGLIELARRRRIHRGLAVTLGLTAAITLPWIGYIYWRTGGFLPGSYYGKQFTYQIAIDYFVGRLGFPRWLAELRPIIFAGLCLGYWIMYYWGGAYLPGPQFDAASAMSGVVSPSWLSALVAVLWIGLVGRGAWTLWRRRGELPEDERWAWLVFTAWLAIHNSAFALWLPAPGTASRYIAVDYVLLAVGLALGLQGFQRMGKWLSIVLLAFFAALTLATLRFWFAVYLSSALQVAEVRMVMARRVERLAPPAAVVAAFDIGAIGYYADRPIVDLGGLTDREFLEYADAGQVDRYLCETGTEFIVAPESVDDGGGSYYDYLGSLGLAQSASLKLVERERVGMEVSVWRAGGTATGNSTAEVVLYEIIQKCD